MSFTITTTAGPHGQITPTQTVTAGNNAFVQVLPDLGYHVATFMVDGVPASLVGGAEYDFFNVQANHTVSVTFAADVVCTVVYNGNGNLSGSAPIDNNSPYDLGSTVTVLNGVTLGRPGYVFNGWNSAADGSGANYAVGSSFTISANLVLYAQWHLILVPVVIRDLPILRRKNATQFNFPLVPNTQVFTSPLNKAVQTYELPGARWRFIATWENLSEADARIMKAWLASLRGASGRFRGGDLSHKRPSGLCAINGTVHGAGQSGRSLVAQWPAPEFGPGGASITADNINITIDTTLITADETGTGGGGGGGSIPNWLLPGDYVGINGELKIITDAVTLGATGLATLAFEPALRNVPADGSPVTITFPTCIFKLDDDQQDKANFTPDRRPTITVSATEVF